MEEVLFHEDDYESIDLSYLFSHEIPVLDNTPLDVPLASNVPDSGPLLDTGFSNVRHNETEDDDFVIRSTFEVGQSSRCMGESSASGMNNEDAHQTANVDPTPSLSNNNNCVCCQILRTINHSNGVNMLKKLEIHGRLGIITHAVLDVYDFDSSFQVHRRQMFDFRREGLGKVKEFLEQYIDGCKQEGCKMLQEPLSNFYEALCVGLTEDHYDDQYNFVHVPLHNTGDRSNDEQPEVEEEITKIPLSLQRERTGKMKMKDFEAYFELPIAKAAKKMRICATVMKKICRKSDVGRWPHRKIRSIQNKKLKKQDILERGSEEEKVRAMADIQMLDEKLAQIYRDLTR